MPDWAGHAVPCTKTPMLKASLLATLIGYVAASALPLIKWRRQDEGQGQGPVTVVIDTIPAGQLYAGDYQNLYLCGHGGAIHSQTSAGGTDIIVQKWNEDGARQWTKLYGGDANEEVADCVWDSDGVIVIGNTISSGFNSQTKTGDADAFVAKYDSVGSVLFTTLKGQALRSVSGRAVAVDASHNIYWAGTTNGNIDSQAFPGAVSAILFKFDQDGVWQWTRITGSSTGNEDPSRAICDSNGNIYVVGSTNNQFGTAQTNSGSYDMMMYKYNSDGDLQYVRMRGGLKDECWNVNVGHTKCALGVDSSDNVYVAGSTDSTDFDSQTLTGKVDFFITKWNSNGDWQWTKLWGEANEHYFLEDMVMDSSGNFFIAGKRQQDGDDANDWFGVMVKFDSVGSWVWTQARGDTGDFTEYTSFVLGTEGRGRGYAVGWTKETFEAAAANPSGLTASGNANDWIITKWQVNTDTTSAPSAGSDPLARYGDTVRKFSLKPNELTLLFETPELLVQGSVFEGGGPWEQWFDRIVVATRSRDRFLRIKMRRDLLEVNNTRLLSSDLRTLDVTLGWGQEDDPGATVTKISGPQVPIPFSFLGHEVAFEKIQRKGQKFPAIGRHLRECAEIAGPSLRFHICSSPAWEYYGHMRHLSIQYAHLDLIIAKIRDHGQVSGLLPELWGLQPMSEKTKSYLDEENDTKLTGLAQLDGGKDMELLPECARNSSDMAMVD